MQIEWFTLLTKDASNEFFETIQMKRHMEIEIIKMILANTNNKTKSNM